LAIPHARYQHNRTEQNILLSPDPFPRAIVVWERDYAFLDL